MSLWKQRLPYIVVAFNGNLAYCPTFNFSQGSRKYFAFIMPIQKVPTYM